MIKILSLAKGGNGYYREKADDLIELNYKQSQTAHAGSLFTVRPPTAFTFSVPEIKIGINETAGIILKKKKSCLEMSFP